MPTVDCSRRTLRWAMLLGPWALLFGAATAQAAPPAPPSPPARLVFARATLRAEAESAHRGRLLANGLSLGLGAASAGIGAVLLAREVTPAGVILTGQGGLVLVGGVYGLVWRKDPFEELMGVLQRLERQDRPSALAVWTLQNRWYELAVRERRWRRIEGTASTVLGAGLITAAAVMAAVPHDMDPTVRGLNTRILLGTGIGFLGAGVARLLVPSGVERSYQAFAGTGTTSALRLSPLPTGAGLALGGTF